MWDARRPRGGGQEGRRNAARTSTRFSRVSKLSSKTSEILDTPNQGCENLYLWRDVRDKNTENREKKFEENFQFFVPRQFHLKKKRKIDKTEKHKTKKLGSN
jgi:hypothetical protein